MITSMRGCVAYNTLWTWPISSRSFSHEFAIKLLKYGTTCLVRSTTCTVLDGFFTYLVQMIIGVRRCDAWNDPLPWPICWRSWLCNKNMAHILSCPLQHTQFGINSFHSWHKWSLASEGVSHAMTFDLDLYLQDYSVVTLSIWWIIFICDTNTTYEGMMCYLPFSGQ